MSLAACLGLIPPGCDNWKDVLYCRDPVTNMLGDILERMEKAGLLKYDAEKDWYLPIDLTTARYVDASHTEGPGAPERAEHSKRANVLRDTKLLWEDDLYRQVGRDSLVYIEDSPEPGKRWSFATTLYWGKRYPAK